jgi:hypothetical protein
MVVSLDIFNFNDRRRSPSTTVHGDRRLVQVPPTATAASFSPDGSRGGGQPLLEYVDTAYGNRRLGVRAEWNSWA